MDEDAGHSDHDNRRQQRTKLSHDALLLSPSAAAAAAGNESKRVRIDLLFLCALPKAGSVDDAAIRPGVQLFSLAPAL